MEQVKATTTTVFETILGPLLPLLRAQCAQLIDEANTYKLSLEPFVVSLVFATLNNIKSISLMPLMLFSSDPPGSAWNHTMVNDFSSFGWLNP